MNAIQKAIELLRNYVGGNGLVIADELEAMLKQEPAAWMLECPTCTGDLTWKLSWSKSGAGVCNRLSGDSHEKALYTDPRPQFDLKALAEDVSNAVRLASFIEKGRYSSRVGFRTVDLVEIVAKHTNNPVHA